MCSAMKLTVVVEGQQFNVACGTGTQDIKWLALTSAQEMESQMVELEKNMGTISTYVGRT